LEPKQSLTVSGFAASSSDLPSVSVGVEGGGGELEMQQELGRRPGELTSEDHVRRALFLVVMAQLGPAVFAGVSSFAYGFFQGIPIALSAIWQVYFYLKAIPHAVALYRDWRLTSRGPAQVVE
jgi:hypothetical protein